LLFYPMQKKLEEKKSSWKSPRVLYL